MIEWKIREWDEKSQTNKQNPFDNCMVRKLAGTIFTHVNDDFKIHLLHYSFHRVVEWNFHP